MVAVAAVETPETAEFTSEERVQMEELRRRLKSWDLSHLPSDFVQKHLYTDDSSMWRYLRAREFQLDKAEEMLKYSITWKHEVGVDALLDEFRGDGVEKAAIKRATTLRAKQAEAMFGGGILHGVKSKTGAHVVVERMGKVDFTGLSKSNDMVELYTLAYTVYLEESWREIRKLGGKHQALMVIDMKGLGLSALRHVSLVKRIAKIGPQSYPEIMKTVVVLNAPSVISHFWHFMGPILPPNTRSKVHIPSKSQVKPLLDELIEGGFARLPKFLGGELTGESICPAEPVSKVLKQHKARSG